MCKIIWSNETAQPRHAAPSLTNISNLATHPVLSSILVVVDIIQVIIIGLNRGLRCPSRRSRDCGSHGRSGSSRCNLIRPTVFSLFVSIHTQLSLHGLLVPHVLLQISRGYRFLGILQSSQKHTLGNVRHRFFLFLFILVFIFIVIFTFGFSFFPLPLLFGLTSFPLLPFFMNVRADSHLASIFTQRSDVCTRISFGSVCKVLVIHSRVNWGFA
mmetsp:Transcript_15637/g.31714  ORF Transcript_15637/g.31714 Transcript_15637/m.31714 type:complete len:214 (+) Transcript_15637:89-730(+)